MKLENKVNQLDGKGWLRNAINFYQFVDFNIDEIYEKFYNFCFKERETGKVYKYNDKYKIDRYDFSFQYLKNKDEINDILKLIYMSAYNSYHVILVDDVIIDEKILVSKIITDFVEKNNLEYRGKIILNFENTDERKLAFLILNRLNGQQESEINFDYLLEKVSFNKKKDYVINSKTKIDKIGLKHPAPYSYNDINTLTQIEKIDKKIILDPFLGVGSTILGTYKNNYNIGIELNEEYINLIKERIEFLKIDDLKDENYKIIHGNSLEKIKKIKEKIDCVITSPPYFNILKNKSKGVRHDNSQSRQGVEYYSEAKDDIGNIDEYTLYLEAMTNIFKDCYKKMNKNGQFYLIISDFTINKKEKDIHSDMILCMKKAGFIYNKTSYILQNQKVIYPFGYPYKLVLNHIYQYIIVFEKGE
ncbi:MAG: DNA methyltransferase [Bacilli bacterium]|nr:DNA methyltransferase [Bacilli bacterium]